MPRKPQTPGRKLVTSIRRDVGDGIVLDERDKATLALIESTADDIAALESACDAVLVADVAGTKKLNPVFTELRLARAQLHRLITSLKLTENELPEPKSIRHQAAANARWARSMGA
jgi:hypothetical protein